MDKYNETYDLVVHVAKAKMIMNAHKGNIEEVDSGVLIQCVLSEVEELNLALNEPMDYFHIIEEVADVLNFAIAAAHTALNDYRCRKSAPDTIDSLLRKAP